MKVGLSTGYWSDALTPLAWWGASTTRVRLGTSIMQMAARTPTAAAMAAITLDHLSGGRFVLGLGASGPQVVEGWYGQPYPKSLARTREYVEIVCRSPSTGSTSDCRTPAAGQAPGVACPDLRLTPYPSLTTRGSVRGSGNRAMKAPL